MPRLLKRDYNTSELLEVAEGLLKRVDDDYKQCYNNVSKQANRIEAAFFRQTIRGLRIKANKEKGESSDLFG